MFRNLINLALLVWFRENIKVIVKASAPILIIFFIFTPLYRLWDSKLSELGYGLHLLSLYTIIYLITFLYSFLTLKKMTTNNKNKEIRSLKKDIYENSDRFDKFLDLEKYPKLERKRDKILKN
tara:strand:+ start:1084 stop:1452 length:369 start_codon:yes stop_codon:yes gene_type:complete